MSSNIRRWARAIVICSLAGFLTISVQAQQPQTVAQGVYTDVQAGRGQAVYTARCSTCHGATLAGRTGPALAGDDFNGIWATQSVSDLVMKIFNTMPKDDTGKLTRQQSTDIVAYMLQVGKFPAGRAELQSDDAALKPISFPAMAVSSPAGG